MLSNLKAWKWGVFLHGLLSMGCTCPVYIKFSCMYTPIIKFMSYAQQDLTNDSNNETRTTIAVI